MPTCSPHHLACSLIIGACLALHVLSLADAADDTRAAPPHISSVPADGIIRFTDHGYRAWGPELIRLQVDVRAFPQEQCELIGPEQKPVPYQIRDGHLLFVAAVDKGASVTYQLRRAAGPPKNVATHLSLNTDAQGLVIANEHLAIRVPAPGTTAYDAPLSNANAIAPLLAVRQGAGPWMAGSHLVGPWHLQSATFGVLDRGPASIRYEALYTFAGGGQYRLVLRLDEGLPYAVITEEFDAGIMTRGENFLVVDLSKDWQPQQAHILECGFGGGEGPVQTKVEDLSTYLPARRTAWMKRGPHDPPLPLPPTTTPVPAQSETAPVLLERINPIGAYGMRGAYGLSHGTQSVHVLPLHSGSWRRAMALTAWHAPNSGISLALPITVRPMDTQLDVSGDVASFPTLTHDSSLPITYGRRQWALVCGQTDQQVTTIHQRAGVIGLDRYKDWILTWPSTGDVAPHAFTSPEIVARLKAVLAHHPEAARLKELYLFTQDPARAAASAQRALALLRKTSDYLTHWENNWGFASYRDGDFSLFLVLAEDALACPSLDPAVRRELQLRLALFAHRHAEPDLAPLGSGSHLGTVNMRIGRTVPGLYYAALLPDHPSYRYWMQHYRDIVVYLLGVNTTVGGAWFEPPLYQIYGPTRWLTLAQTMLYHGGWGDLGALGYQRATLLYNADLTVLDPRFGGMRMFPGMGNGGNTVEAVFGFGMGVVATSDPDTAGFLRSRHRSMVANEQLSRDPRLPEFSLNFLPDVPERPRQLTSRYIPGYGVVFRAHEGNPAETTLLFRCGYNRSHWEVDDLNVILYGKGAPLSPGTGYQYYSGKGYQCGSLFNRCVVGRLDRDDPNGRIHTDVQDYAFGADADYAVGRMYYAAEELGDGQGELEWRRHILFLKSPTADGPTYAVMRDSYTGFEGIPTSAQRPAWWTWLNLERADHILVDGKPFSADSVPEEKLVPLSELPTQHGRTIETTTNFGASTWFWFASPQPVPVTAVMTMAYPNGPADFHHDVSHTLPLPPRGAIERKTIFRVSGDTQHGFCYVVFPRRNGEAPPQCDSKGPGRLTITTQEATDYVMVGDQPQSFTDGDIEFSGKAGTVRVFADRVVLSLTSGSGRIGYRGTVLEGHAPFTRSIPMSDLKPGVIAMGGYEKRIATVDLGEGITVRGEVPFSAERNGTTIRIHTQGRARQFIVAGRPEWLLNPQFLLDGQEWMALVSDVASQNWGRYQRSEGLCCSTTDGEHDLIIRPRPNWPTPWECGLRNTLTR